MTRKPRFAHLITLSLSSFLGFAVCGLPLLAIAQEYIPPKRGIPGRREGAGTRGTCMRGPKLLMPLTPADGFSVTTSNTPTFFWYVPATSAKTAEFALLDGNDTVLYKTTLPLTALPGIVSYSLPAAVTASILTPGKDYNWQFSILCDPNQPSLDPFVEGVVQRVKPDAKFTSQLKKANLRDRPNLYAASGIWQDAIASLAQQRCAQPQDTSLVANWTKLLQSVQLSDFAEAPIAQACPAKPTP